jgi:hypothetical protein
MLNNNISNFTISMSDTPKTELDVRTTEIKLYIRTLQPLSTNFQDTNLLKIGMSSVMLMLYNLIEGVVREVLESVILSMNKNRDIKYLHLQDNLQKYACYYAIEKIIQVNKNKLSKDVGQSVKVLKQNKKDLENKIYEVVSGLLNSMSGSSNMQLHSKYLEFAGSIDLELLIDIAQTFYIGTVANLEPIYFFI